MKLLREKNPKDKISSLLGHFFVFSKEFYSINQWLNRSNQRMSIYKVEKPNGDIIKIPAYLLRSISKGYSYGEFFIKGTENEVKARELENKSKLYGFRTKVEKEKNGYLLKIYGDSQQEVDDFITLSLEQDFDISPYI